MPDFNAYSEWLDIPADKPSPNHYELLGVMQFESDLATIGTALADRQVILKSVADGSHGECAEQLLIELDAAVECLLDPDAKTAYDQQLLEARFFTTPPPKSAAAKKVDPKPATTQATVVEAPVESEAPVSVPKPVGKKADEPLIRGIPKPVPIETAAKSSRSSPASDDPFDSNVAYDPAAIKVTCPECGASLRLKSRASFGESHPCPKCEIPFVLDESTNRDSYEIDQEALRAAPQMPDLKPLRKRKVRRPEPKEEKPVLKRNASAAAASPSELIPEKKVAKRKDSPGPEPTEKPRKRKLNLKENPLGVGLAVGGLIAVVMLASSMLGPRGNVPAPVPAPAPYEVADNTGQRNAAAPRRSVPEEPDTDTQPDEPSDNGESTGVVAEQTDPDTVTQVADVPKKGIIDLIPLINLDHPALVGNWSRVDGALSTTGIGLGQLPIEIGLPDAYELTLEVDQVRGNNGILIGLQIANQHVVVVIDGWSAQASGLGLIDGQPADGNEASVFGRWLSPDEPNVIQCAVGENFVSVTCNDLPVVDWQGDVSRLRLPPEYQQPTTSTVFLATDNTAYRISRLELSSSSELPPEPQSLADSENAIEPMPDKAALTKAAALVREVFQSDISAARTPAQKLDMANKLLEQGRDKSNNDAAARYVMLKAARDLAVAAGDVDETLAIVTVIRQDFRVDAHSSRAEVFESLRSAAKTPQALVAMATAAAAAAGEAIDAEDFGAARALLKTIDATAARIRGRDLQPVLAGLRKEIAARQAMAEQFTAASAALKADPYDSAAYFARGRYLCLARGLWPSGLQAFAKTSDKVLASLVKQDLANPTDPQEQLSLADGWWNWMQASQKRKEFAAVPHYWYSRAIPSLAGLAKAKAEKRIEELGTPRVVRPVD
jgi:hypothetical protein